MPDVILPRYVVAVVERRKAWWRSKVLWFNAVALALAAAEAHLQLLRGVLPAQIYAWLAFAVPVVNGALRLFTSSGVALSGEPPVVERDPPLGWRHDGGPA